MKKTFEQIWIDLCKASGLNDQSMIEKSCMFLEDNIQPEQFLEIITTLMSTASERYMPVYQQAYKDIIDMIGIAEQWLAADTKGRRS